MWCIYFRCARILSVTTIDVARVSQCEKRVPGLPRRYMRHLKASRSPQCAAAASTGASWISNLQCHSNALLDVFFDNTHRPHRPSRFSVSSSERNSETTTPSVHLYSSSCLLPTSSIVSMASARLQPLLTLLVEHDYSIMPDYYHYATSIPAAICGAVFFSVLVLLHVALLFGYQAWYLWAFYIGTCGM